MTMSSTFPIEFDKENKWAYTINVILIYMAVQAVIGWLLFEWAWSKTGRIREVDEERDDKFHSFRRLDAKRWARWKMYPGALLIMPTRLVLILITLII